MLLAPTLLHFRSNGSQGVQVSIGVFFVDSEGMTNKRRLLPRYTPQGLPVDFAMAAAYFTAETGCEMVAIMVIHLRGGASGRKVCRRRSYRYSVVLPAGSAAVAPGAVAEVACQADTRLAGPAVGCQASASCR